MTNKKNISVRLSDADLRSLKVLSNKLQVKDSDLFRFSIRSSLHRLMPLMYGDLKGASLLIALLSCGGEMLRYFQFDAHTLAAIVNYEVDSGDVVDMEDIELAVLSLHNQEFLTPRLAEKFDLTDTSKNSGQLLMDYLRKKYVDKTFA